jgi:osmotically-inducible protein OsmY
LNASTSTAPARARHLRLALRAGVPLVLAASLLVSACAPLIVGGAVVGGTLIAADRRTSGAQLEDQAIELKAGPRVREVLGDRGNVNVTSYNRMVLLTGEVPTEADKAAVDQAVQRVENVKSVVNELAVMGASSLGARSADAILSAKVKASLVDDPAVPAAAVKVVAERSIVYLMGRVTEAEAAKATERARTVAGVQRVVRIFEILSPAEVSAIVPRPVTPPASPR